MPDDLLAKYAATETLLWVAERHGKNRFGERQGFSSLQEAVDAIRNLPDDMVVVDLLVHEPGYDRALTAAEIDGLLNRPVGTA